MMMKFLRRAFVAVGALTLGASLAVAQQGRVVDPRTVPELKAEFDRAVKLGLPTTEPLESYARKGYLFQRSQRAIVDAVHDMADRMVRASKALSPVRSDAEITAGEQALYSNVPEKVLRRLRQVQKNRSIAVPLGVLTSLVERGVPLQKAAASVETMLQQNVADDRMVALATSVTKDVAQGVAPTTALDLRSKGVLSLPQAPVAGVAAPAVIRPPLP